MTKPVVYSEIFQSMQGEGHFTGAPSVWIRLFLCQLQCDGFGQKDPTDPSTYELPYQDFDLDTVERVEDLPVWKYGCDSSYTWAKKFKRLMKEESASEVVDKLQALMSNPHNPDGLWGNRHFCITGGEPLLKNNQKAVVALLEEMERRSNVPKNITFETNSITPLTEELFTVLNRFRKQYGVHVFMSMSPKLFRVSGEQEKKAIKPASIRSLAQYCDDYQLKFVVDDSEETLADLERILKMLEDDIMFSNFSRSKVWLMPVGAREEEQHDITKSVAEIALQRGYNLAVRAHVFVYGNQIGT